MSEFDRKVTPITIQYIERLVDTFTMGEANAVLSALGKYHLAEIWYVRRDSDSVSRVCRDGDGVYWESQCFNKVPVSHTCVLKYVKLEIRFFGGPPTKQSYQKGTLRTYVCDRLLTACALMGKSHTNQRIFKALARVRARCES
jgi:hypothetical protein